MRRLLRDSMLDLLGIAALVVFALLTWPPAALLVVAAAAFYVSWRRSS